MIRTIKEQNKGFGNLTNSPLEILTKTMFWASWEVFLSLSCYKALKLTIKPSTGCTLIQMENTSFAKVRHAQKPKFRDSLILGFKVTQQSWLLIFAFSLPLCFCFSCLFFFFFAEHLVGFILVGNVFRKALRISELDERKGRWVVEQDFHGIFQVNVTWFFCLFLWCPWLNCAHFGMVWKISTLCTS